MPGHIHFFGNFRVDDIAPLGNTLFWSAATLEEMEPAAVAHYGRAITPLAESLYLHGCFGDGAAAALRRAVDSERRRRSARTSTAFPEHELVDRRVAHTGLAELVDRVGTTTTRSGRGAGSEPSSLVRAGRGHRRRAAYIAAVRDIPDQPFPGWDPPAYRVDEHGKVVGARARARTTTGAASATSTRSAPPITSRPSASRRPPRW